MWIKPVTLRGRFVRLEPMEPRHAPDFLAAADPELYRHTVQHPPEWTVAGFEKEIATVVAMPNSVAFAIVLESTGKAIGRSTLMDIKPEHRGVEIGRTWITRSMHGTMVNPEAKLLMLRHVFEEITPPAIRVQLTTGSTNKHSQRAIAKLGATREGELRDSRIVTPRDPTQPQEIRGTIYFSILAAEWAGVKRGLEERLARFGG